MLIYRFAFQIVKSDLELGLGSKFISVDQPVFLFQTWDSLVVLVSREQDKVIPERDCGNECINRAKLPALATEYNLKISGILCIALFKLVILEDPFDCLTLSQIALGTRQGTNAIQHFCKSRNRNAKPVSTGMLLCQM